MADLIFADSHNMVAYLEKSEDNADFVEIFDFLNASPIRYALTVSPTVYVSYIEQFWSTAKIKTVNNETQIRAKVDGKTIAITESSVRRNLHFNDEDVFNDEYDTPSHSKKVFANMIMQGKDFSGTVTPLFATMLIQSQAVEGEGSGQPTKSQHTPTTASPSHVEPIPIYSGPTTLVTDETIHEERGDSVKRAATTTTSLDAEHVSGNINMTQSTAIPNDPFPQGIGSGGSHRRQDTILGDRHAQTRIKSSAERSLGDSEDAPKQGRNEIDQDEGISWFQEDLETQGRYGHVIGVNTASTSITTASINITIVEPVTTASAPITTAGVSVSTAEPSTLPPTTITVIEDEDLTIAQTLMKIRSEKSKEKSKEKGVSRETATRLARGVIVKEASETATRSTMPPLQIDPKDKGKVIMQEPEKPVKVKGKDQIEYDADVAQRLQAELDEEARLKRERKEEACKAANIAE
ncbi:hypothetical protein Tco_1160323 [Tanacetum coccineum]